MLHACYNCGTECALRYTHVRQPKVVSCPRQSITLVEYALLTDVEALARRTPRRLHGSGEACPGVNQTYRRGASVAGLWKICTRTRCTVPTTSCWRVPWEVVPTGTSRNASWTRCAPLEPALFESRARRAMESTSEWGRAGPRGAHVNRWGVRSLSIRGAVAPAECQNHLEPPHSGGPLRDCG